MGTQVNTETYRCSIEHLPTEELEDLADEMFEKHSKASEDDTMKALMTKARVIDDLLLERKND